jgi:regulatory protein
MDADARQKSESLALYYVGRFAVTQAKLQKYLSRKIREKFPDEENTHEAIEAIVEKMVALGYVNDAAYAQARVRSLSRKGLGARRITGDLHYAGVDEPTRETALEEGDHDPLAAAHAFARRKRLGRYAVEGVDEVHDEGEGDEASAHNDKPQHNDKAHQKAVAAMLRAGHSYAIVKQVLEGGKDSYDDTRYNE